MSDEQKTKERTTVWADAELYVRLRQKLLGQGLTFTDWIDKQIRKELGLSPRFSYGRASPETE